jgi:Uma2 family endonuclease
MPVETLISLEEYLRTSLDPDCDFVAGQLEERNVGKRRHGYAQAHIATWFVNRRAALGIESFTEQRLMISNNLVRIPDVVVTISPCPDEEVFTSPPYICVEVMSPDDTLARLQDRVDDYIRFGVPNIWVVDPWKKRGWTVTKRGWQVAEDGILRTGDQRVALQIADVLMP